MSSGQLDRLPPEIVVQIAKELGNDVFRLRKHLSIFASTLILETALLAYESHLPHQSIRKPLNDLRSVLNSEEWQKELEEREALYWQHRKGPRKMLTTYEIPLWSMSTGNMNWVEVPLVSYRYLAYVVVEHGAGLHSYHIHDLLDGISWTISLGTVFCVVHIITDSMIVLATTDSFYTSSLDELNEVKTLEQMRPTSLPGITQIEEYGEKLALLVNGDVFVWDGQLSKIYELEGEGGEDDCWSIAVKDAQILHMTIRMDDEDGLHCTLRKLGGSWCKTYHFPGADPPDDTRLLWTGDSWVLGGLILENGYEMEEHDRIWKDRLYELKEYHIAWHVGEANHPSISVRAAKARVCGSCRKPWLYAPGTETRYILHDKGDPKALLVNHSFMVVLLEDGENWVWTAYTFEDLKGKEVIWTTDNDQGDGSAEDGGEDLLVAEDWCGKC